MDDRRSAYRDGLRAVLEPFVARRARANERAAALGPEARAELPKPAAGAIEALERRLRTTPTTAAELADAELALDAYEQQVEEALWLGANLKSVRAAERFRRWFPLAVVSCLALVVPAVLGAKYVDYRGRVADAHRSCRASSQCRDDGHCEGAGVEYWKPGYQCLARSQEDCARSEHCVKDGRCSLDDGECRVRRTEDCRRARRCVEEGACEAKDGWCVTTKEGCRASAACAWEGRCAAHAAYVGAAAQCVATDAEDCARASQCAGTHCVVDEGSCRPCFATRHCRERGQCTWQDGRCVVASDADCRKTQGCEFYGACTAHAGTCVVAVP